MRFLLLAFLLTVSSSVISAELAGNSYHHHVVLDCGKPRSTAGMVEIEIKTLGDNLPTLKVYSLRSRESSEITVIEGADTHCRIETLGSEPTLLGFGFVFRNFPDGVGFGGNVQQAIFDGLLNRTRAGELNSKDIYFVYFFRGDKSAGFEETVLTFVDRKLVAAVRRYDGEPREMEIVTK